MLHPGTNLGRYTILDLVAVGGMGEVYRAEDARLHRDVAIKVLPSHLERDRTSLDRFYREARAVAELAKRELRRARAESIGGAELRDGERGLFFARFKSPEGPITQA